MFYPPGLESYSNGFWSALKADFDLIHSTAKWIFAELRAGRIVLPVGLMATVADLFVPFYKSPYSSFSTVRQLYMARSRGHSVKDEYLNEFVATYIRYMAKPEELFGENQFCTRAMNRFVLRVKLYRALLKIVYLFLRPVECHAWHRAYLHSFVPLRLACDASIPVFVKSISATSAWLQQGLKGVPRQWCWIPYASNLVPEEGSCSLLLLAKEQLDRRLKGAVDSGIHYMSISPYLANADRNLPFYSISSLGGFYVPSLVELCSTGDFVVLYMHEFSDYQHNGVLPGFVFSYFDWLKQTLLFLSDFKIQYVLKIHPAILDNPDRYPASMLALQSLPKLIGNSIPLCDPNLTSLQLSKSGMTAGITIRGTVALELVHMGIPVICAGFPPYMNFLPSRIYSERQEYLNALRAAKLNALPPVSEDEKNAVYRYLSLTA